MEFSQYVGRPYAQPFGCFELVRSVVIEQLGVEVPDYASAITEAQRTAAFLLLMDRHADRVDAPLEGDVILIGPPGAPYHCGIVVDPARCRMLHSIDQRGAHLDRYDGPRWRARVESFWRVR